MNSSAWEGSPCDSRDSCKSCLCRSTWGLRASSPENSIQLRKFSFGDFSCQKIVPSHLLLNDFVLLGVLCEALRCTFQVPQVNQPVQSAPGGNSLSSFQTFFKSSTSPSEHYEGCNCSLSNINVERISSLGHNAPLSHHCKRIHNWVLSIVL